MRRCLKILVAALFPLVMDAQTQHQAIDSLKFLLGKEKNDSTRVWLLLEIGDEYRYRNSKMDSSFEYYQRGVELTEKIGSLSLKLSANRRIAGLYNTAGNYPGALKLSLENLKNAEEVHDTNSIFFVKREMMWTYEGIGDHPKGLEMAKELTALLHLAFFRKTKDWLMYEFIAYHNLASIYQSMNQLDSALFYRKLVYDYSKQNKASQGLALATSTLGELYGVLNKVDSAVYYNKLGVYYAEEAGRFDILRGVQLSMASLFAKTKQLDSALYYATLVFNECKNIPDTVGMTDASLLLSDLYKDRKQFDSAYTYLSLFHDLKDRSLAQEKIEKVQNLSFNELLHRKQLEQEAKDARQQYNARIKIYSLIVGLLVMLSLAIIFYRNNRQKQKANIKIEKAYDNLKATQQQLVQSEKMASLGELTAGIAHEIQNPLNFVNNFSELNSELIAEMKQEIQKGNQEEVKTIANNIDDNEQKINFHGKRADAIVKGMLQHSRSSSGVKEPTDINALADEYLRLAYHGLRAKDKSFKATMETDFDETIGNINLIPQDIGRVILNLINNAFYAVNEKQKQNIHGYEPTVTVTSRKLSGKVELRVIDNGNGVPQKVLDKIFQPFFTTKPTGEGTGLGLSLSYDIITKGHGGELKVETKEGRGSEFIIQLPVN